MDDERSMLSRGKVWSETRPREKRESKGEGKGSRSSSPRRMFLWRVLQERKTSATLDSIQQSGQTGRCPNAEQFGSFLFRAWDKAKEL